MLYTLISMIDKPLVALMVLIAFVSALLICMTFHEFAHAHAAYKEGDGTAKALKRYTLNPFAHIDVWGLILLLVFGIGFAKPVPIDSRNFKRGRHSMLRVSFAGVLVNLLIGTIACFIYALILKLFPALFSDFGLISQLYYYFFVFVIQLNFMFAFFNLLPIYPLDGFRVVQSLTSPGNKFVEFMKRFGVYIMLLLLFTNLLDVYINVFAGGLQDVILNLFYKLFGLI